MPIGVGTFEGTYGWDGKFSNATEKLADFKSDSFWGAQLNAYYSREYNAEGLQKGSSILSANYNSQYVDANVQYKHTIDNTNADNNISSKQYQALLAGKYKGSEVQLSYSKTKDEIQDTEQKQYQVLLNSKYKNVELDLNYIRETNTLNNYVSNGGSMSLGVGNNYFNYQITQEMQKEFDDLMSRRSNTTKVTMTGKYQGAQGSISLYGKDIQDNNGNKERNYYVESKAGYNRSFNGIDITGQGKYQYNLETEEKQRGWDIFVKYFWDK